MTTIDPGMEETAQQVVDDDTETQPSKAQAVQDEEDPEPVNRWWFASTACPLLAATFGPIANGFSVGALVYSWRVYLPGDTLVSLERAFFL